MLWNGKWFLCRKRLAQSLLRKQGQEMTLKNIQILFSLPRQSCPIFVEKALELPLRSRKTIKTNAWPTVSFRRISRLGKSESNVYGWGEKGRWKALNIEVWTLTFMISWQEVCRDARFVRPLKRKYFHKAVRRVEKRLVGADARTVRPYMPTAMLCNTTDGIATWRLKQCLPPTFHYDATNALRERTSASLSLRFLLPNFPKKSLVGLEMGGQGIFL